MSYIDKFFHLYPTLDNFHDSRDHDRINPDSICFIEETGQIYTQTGYYGINKKVFTELSDYVTTLGQRLNNALGTLGDSVNNNIIDNLQDIADFLEGFTENDTLKSYIATQVNNAISGITNIPSDLTQRLTNLENNKVDKVDGKGLSTNDFTNTYKEKVDSLKKVANTSGSFNAGDIIYNTTTNTLSYFNGTGVISIAGVNDIGSVDFSNYYTKSEVSNLLNNKVTIVTGKGLSTNDFTNEYKTMLDDPWYLVS